MTLAQISYTLRVLHLEMVPYRAEIRKSRIKGVNQGLSGCFVKRIHDRQL